jgi:hypothetical protein
MITPIDLHAGNIVGYHIEGNVTATELQSLYEQLMPHLMRHKKMRVYAEYVEISSIDWSGIWKG